MIDAATVSGIWLLHAVAAFVLEAAWPALMSWTLAWISALSASMCFKYQPINQFTFPDFRTHHRSQQTIHATFLKMLSSKETSPAMLFWATTRSNVCSVYASQLCFIMNTWPQELYNKNSATLMPRMPLFWIFSCHLSQVYTSTVSATEAVTCKVVPRYLSHFHVHELRADNKSKHVQACMS